MEVLKLEKTTAKKLFGDAPEWFREVLIDTFGKQCFSEKITDRIKSFEDACNEAGISQDDLFNSSDTLDEIAYKKLKLIIKVINQGWAPNWDDNNEKKWFPIFNLSSGFGFSFSGYSYSNANASVGSRLCFQTKKLSDYIATQFLDIYKDFLT